MVDIEYCYFEVYCIVIWNFQILISNYVFSIFNEVSFHLEEFNFDLLIIVLNE